jgi:hypothetical protein
MNSSTKGLSMKLNLGRLTFFVVILLCVPNLFASVYTWKIVQSPQSLYVHQSGIVRYECTFDNSAAEYTVEFKPIGDELYTASILTQRDQIIRGKRVLTFDVLVRPRIDGNVPIKLNTLVRHTTFASIENATIGRDNVKKYDFDDENVSLPIASISVKPNATVLSGDFTLEVAVDKHSVVAHEPVHLSIYIRGAGNLDKYSPYELNISGVTFFREAPLRDISPDSMGYRGEIREEFALVADKNYIIPPITLEFFDIKTQKVKKFQTQSIAIEVASGFQAENLLDIPQITDYSGWKKYGFYTLLVAFGIGLGEMFRWIWKYRPRKKSKHFWDEATTPKELVTLLALSGDKRYEKIIEALEAGTIELREAKKRLTHEENQ